MNQNSYVSAVEWWNGYYEKANSTSKYLIRSKDVFTANAGGANYTYMGVLCGCNPGAWCAMTVSTCAYEACGNDKTAAKKALWGRWPHWNCGTLADDAKTAGKFHWSWYGLNKMGKSGSSYQPQKGDVIIFTNSWSTRDHTGIVYNSDSSNVYTYEGNSGDKCRTRSYPLSSSYIYGYCTPVFDESGGGSGSDQYTGKKHYIAKLQELCGMTGSSVDGEYGPKTKTAAIKAHQTYLKKEIKCSYLSIDGEWGNECYYATYNLRKGDKSTDVKIWQGLLYCAGYDPVGMDGEFGDNTEKATIAFQTAKGLNPTGLADSYTFAVMFGCKKSTHVTLSKKSSRYKNHYEIMYMQNLLIGLGYSVGKSGADGDFGSNTYKAVMQFQSDNGLTADGECGPLTWAALEAKAA